MTTQKEHIKQLNETVDLLTKQIIDLEQSRTKLTKTLQSDIGFLKKKTKTNGTQ